MKDSPNNLIVFSDDWGRHPSSCQHLVRRLQDRWRILWVNTIGTRRPSADLFTARRGWEKLTAWQRGLRQVGDQMWVLDAPMLPMAGRWARAINRRTVTSLVRRALKRLKMHDPVVLTTLPPVVWWLGDVGQRAWVYNCTDDYSRYPSADAAALQAAERQISERADLVLAASRKLEELHRTARSCLYFPHAVDYEHFATAANRGLAIPQQLANIPRPRVGFFGLVYEKLDFDLLSQLAKQLPVQLVMLGPVDYCPDAFRRLPNVHLLGQQPYAELPQWLAGLDVLLMPYMRDEMIWQSSPLKLRECLATGKPTVSVDIPEVRKFTPHVTVAQDQPQFIAAVRAALAERQSLERCQQRQQAVKNDTWAARADQLDELLRSLAQVSRCQSGIEELSLAARDAADGLARA